MNLSMFINGTLPRELYQSNATPPAGSRPVDELGFYQQTAAYVLSEATQKYIEEIAREKAELQAWRLVAVHCSAATSGTDVSTPQKFRTAQLHALGRLLDEATAAKKQLGDLRAEVLALLGSVDKSSPAAWFRWLDRRDQLVKKLQGIIS